MPSLQGRVLLVRILNAMYPVTLDMLNHVFSLYGSVEKIVYASTAHQVLIQYQQHQMASLALRLLQGHSLYQSCCYLEVKYALGSELQVLCPSLGVGNIFACESTEHDTSTMPNQRVIEQSAPMQILDELPSSHGPKVAVKLCKSEVVQAATMVSQGSPASSTPLLMHVDDMQVSISVQDVPGMFEEMPVYDVYEEDRSASLTFVSELCEIVGQQNQYASEKPIYDCEEPHCGAKSSSGESDHGLLAVCFNNASDNAFSHEATDFTFPIGHVIHADRSVNLTNEKSIQAASSLFVQGTTVHYTDESSEINFKKQDMLINKHGIPGSNPDLSFLKCGISPCQHHCDLNNDKEGLPWDLRSVRSTTRCSVSCLMFSLRVAYPILPSTWDPGIQWFSYKKLHFFPLIPCPLHNMNISSMWELSLEKGKQVQWDPGIKLFLYELLRLETLSKETEYAMRLLLVVKYDTQIDTTANMCCSPTYLLQQKSNIAAVLHFWRSIFDGIPYCQIFQRYTAMSLLFHCHGIPLWLIHFQVP
ncbi:uncharacterized protein LOC124680753 isoform X1 [Lolium rigidum]|uniref:uncharacterized protein LOC124680753 isoform X1 n=1 Tax=Lolium rigidum TaxID=89674 RepID=UPI001F5D7F2A|nr:uncharacterized protein LOC124680753 isoform X1 [Lolium rigidum]